MKRIAISSLFVACVVSSADSDAKLSTRDACELINASLRNNIDTIVRVEMVNFQLKKDEIYTNNYGMYYDEALAHYDLKTLSRAIDSVSNNCPF